MLEQLIKTKKRWTRPARLLRSRHFAFDFSVEAFPRAAHSGMFISRSTTRVGGGHAFRYENALSTAKVFRTMVSKTAYLGGPGPLADEGRARPRTHRLRATSIVGSGSSASPQPLARKFTAQRRGIILSVYVPISRYEKKTSATKTSATKSSAALCNNAWTSYLLHRSLNVCSHGRWLTVHFWSSIYQGSYLMSSIRRN